MTLVHLMYAEEVDKDEFIEKLAEVDGGDVLALAKGL